MSEPKYSDFTLNFNPVRARGNRQKAPDAERQGQGHRQRRHRRPSSKSPPGDPTRQRAADRITTAAPSSRRTPPAARQLEDRARRPGAERHRGLRAQASSARCACSNAPTSEIARRQGQRQERSRASTAMGSCCFPRARATSTSRPGIARSTVSIRAMRRCTIRPPPRAARAARPTTEPA